MKTMKAEIFIEQYGNGISLKWKDVEDNIEPETVVALDNDKINTVGKIIWDDITLMMQQKQCNIVKMTIEYQAVKEEQQ